MGDVKASVSGMLGHVLHQVNAFAAVGPFIVVPGDKLHELIIESHACACIKHRSAAFSQQIVGHDGIFGIAEDA